MEWRTDRAVELAIAFERVREICGFPLIVDSAYRTPHYNGLINGGRGGALKSQHMEGRALDLRPPVQSAKNLRLLREAAGQARREGLLRGIGSYANFVHIDTRTGFNASWSGPRAYADNVIA